MTSYRSGFFCSGCHDQSHCVSVSWSDFDTPTSSNPHVEKTDFSVRHSQNHVREARDEGNTVKRTLKKSQKNNFPHFYYNVLQNRLFFSCCVISEIEAETVHVVIVQSGLNFRIFQVIIRLWDDVAAHVLTNAAWTLISKQWWYK